MVSFTTLLALSASALAAPAPQTPTPPSPIQNLPAGYAAPWAWHVTKWEAGCGRSSCSYNFDIFVPTNQGQVRTGNFHCLGYENAPSAGLDNIFTQCEAQEPSSGGLSAVARFRKRDGDEFPKVVEISVLVPAFDTQVNSYNFTAYGDVVYNLNVAPALNFEVYPTVWAQVPNPN